MQNSVTKCSDCNIPFEFEDIVRERFSTLAIYRCPKCKKVCID